MQTTLSRLRPSDAYLAEATPETFTEQDYLRAVCLDYGFTATQLKDVLNTPEGRVQATKSRLCLFSLIYLRDRFIMPTGPLAGQVTVNDLTLHAFRTASMWLQPVMNPGEHRWLWVAPRGAGKSTMLLLVIPLWLAAHGHTKYIVAYSYSFDQAKQRLSDFRNVLNLNALMKSDFPELTIPAKRGSFVESDQAAKYKAKSRFTYHIFGAGGAHPGLLEDGNRPSIILIDDFESGGETFSPYITIQRLKTFREVVLGLNPYAHVAYSGTTTAYGSVIHQALMNNGDKSNWVTEERFQITHFLPVITESNGRRRSTWPARWSLEWLDEEAKLNDRTYALNYMNQPLSAGDGTYWNSRLFIYDRLPSVSKRIISIDPGIATKTTSDPTGICVASFSQAARKASIDECLEVTAKSIELKRVILSLISKYRDIDTLLWEDNQGGSMLAESVLGHDFTQTTGVRISFIHAKQSKQERSELLLSRYKQQNILHNPDSQLSSYETELLSAPFWMRSPNQTDAAAHAIQFLAGAKI